jgi:hypothetical protein
MPLPRPHWGTAVQQNKISKLPPEHGGEIVKIGMLAVSLIGLRFICTAFADDLPRIGYSLRTPVKNLVAKRYRWVTVDGPYACVTEQEVRQITSNRTDLMELHLVEDGHAYSLIPGTLVQVTRDHPANGMSKTLLGGITKPLWTYSNFLTARPIRDIYEIADVQPSLKGLSEFRSPRGGKTIRVERAFHPFIPMTFVGFGSIKQCTGTPID